MPPSPGAEPTRTIPLLEQLRASRQIYAAALERMESLSDDELRSAICGGGTERISGATLARLAAVASGATLDRLAAVASDATLDRLAAVASGATLDRLAAAASDATLDRLAAVASDATLDRLAAVASDATLDRLAAVASGATLDRLAAVASDATLARLAAAASGATLARLAAAASGATLARLAAVASDATLDRLARLRDLQVPVVPDLDRLVAEKASAGLLNMKRWHCGTTHCRAGWAVVLAGEAGARLEEALGSEQAGRLIYEASTGRPAPDFYATDAAAAEDIRRCAALAANASDAVASA